MRDDIYTTVNDKDYKALPSLSLSFSKSRQIELILLFGAWTRRIAQCCLGLVGGDHGHITQPKGGAEASWPDDASLHQWTVTVWLLPGLLYGSVFNNS